MLQHMLAMNSVPDRVPGWGSTRWTAKGKIPMTKHQGSIRRLLGIAAAALAAGVLTASGIAGEPAEAGYLVVTGAPGLEVLLNGQAKGMTPQGGFGLVIADIPPGRHEVRLMKEGLHPQSFFAEVRADEVAVINANVFTPDITVSQEGEVLGRTLQAQTGSLLIRTIPNDADISIPKLGVGTKVTGGKKRPDWRIRAIPVGDYDAQVSIPGHETGFKIRIEEEFDAEYLVNVLSGEVADLGAAKREERLRMREQWSSKLGRPGSEPGERVVVELAGGVPMAWRWCPPGEIATEAASVSGFWMSETEVTQAQWRAVMGPWSGDSNYEGARRPVDTVSLGDVWPPGGYLAAVRRQTGVQTIHLPTEAQWEYACRAGTATRFHSGDSEADLARVGWCGLPINEGTREVGLKEANTWGLHDMHGNVQELCRDGFEALERGDDRPISPSEIPQIFRGGHFGSSPEECEPGARSVFSPTASAPKNGFRLVVNP
ncbi:MAG: SUMF1/EgtB/PvdO family nonheme iron enzyme [Candidatus Sumerlaeia bacterium]|nr:SUMF1/EgtB/PvdO family nonheme iron enzyme [Candidatus Sumerlaeia bacterium]